LRTTNKYTLILRKATDGFHSIENVFGCIASITSQDIIELPHESNGFLNRFLNIIWLRRNVNGPIHITGHDHYLLWFKFKYKAILTIHDVESLNRKRGFKKYLFKLLWFDIPIRNADYVTTISQASLDAILSIRNYKTPISVIANPIANDLKKIEKEFNDDRPRVLHIGTKLNKNIERTILALSSIKCKLIIIGPTIKEMDAWLGNFNQPFEIKENLTRVELLKEYAKCDVLSFVSTVEGFGLPIIEAQAIGRVVITSNVSSMPEVAGKGAYLVDPYNVDDIAAAMLKILSDKSLRLSLIENGYKNVKRFEVEQIIIEYSNIYSSL